jgi:hypothetical protein
MPVEADDPKLVPYPVAVLEGLRKRLREEPDVWLFCGPPLGGEAFSQLVDVLSRLLPGAKRDAVRDSLQDLSGVPITREVVEKLIWRLVGGLNLLRKGVPALPWSRSTSDHWVPVTFVSSRPGVDPRTKQRAICLQVRILAGPEAGLTTVKWVSSRFCRWLASHLGFNRKLRFELHRDLVLLSAYALLMARDDSELRISKFTVTSSLVTRNHAIIALRARVSFQCPYGFSHACHMCHIGYKHCPVGTHRETFVWKYCAACETENWFDPESPDVCVRCS